MARINRDDIDKLHDYGLHIPSRTICLDTSVGDEGEDHGVGYVMAQRAIKNLRLLDHASSDPITLIINTGGGCVFQGMGIYDAIRACRSHVVGVVIGEACSMGSVIVQACDERRATPNSTIMFHAGTLDSGSDVPFREGVRAVAYEHKFGEDIERLMWTRAKTKKPKLSWEKFKTECDRGLYLTAEEAVAWGFLDSIEGGK